MSSSIRLPCAGSTGFSADLLLPEAGIYFGVPISNFVGWALVAPLSWAGISGLRDGEPGRWDPRSAASAFTTECCASCPITGRIGEGEASGAGILVHVAVILVSIGCGRC